MSDVVDNRDAHRYELVEDGHKAVATYKRAGDVVTIDHTIVPPELQGRGIAGRLVRAALADIRAQGLKLVPECPFVAAYVDKHPEERDLLA